MTGERWIFGALFLWLTPILAVGAGGVGLTLLPAILAGALLSAVVAFFSSQVLARRLPWANASRPLKVALGLAAAVAIVRFGALTVFMADVGRVEFSVEPHDPFRREHSCLSAYAESARFLSEGDHNIYERALYRSGGVPRAIGSLRVDPFHYPPPFLLLPQAVRLVAADFWDLRRIWFALQALTLAGAALGLAAWIGGTRGTIALLGGTVLFALPHAAATLQQGNFQITAVPLAAVGFVLLMCGRRISGGGLLAYAALAKIFPGVLVVPLVTGRHWRRVAWVAGAGVALLAITVTIQDVRPFRDFVSTSLPEISSGAAFPQTELRPHSRVNWSAYGETVRLRQLGAAWLTQPRGRAVAQVYGVLVIALAAWAGWRRRFDLSIETERLALLQLTLAVISLASFRSPFVGAVYGGVATLWLMGFCTAGASGAVRQIAWFAALCGLAMAIWVVPSPAREAPDAWIWITALLVLVCMGINVWAVLMVARKPHEAAADPGPRAFAAHP